MGAETELLLVSRRGFCAGAASALALAGCGRESEQAEPRLAKDRVDPADHDSFFLWPGACKSSVLDRARVVYALAGEVRHDDATRLVPLRAPPRADVALWLVVRTERLDWSQSAYRDLLRTLARWRADNPRLVGIQIDFDARTRALAGYAAFLQGLRARLPSGLGLSATGLLDWAGNGRTADMRALAETLDEIVVQTYQDRETVPGYARYLAPLAELPLPFRVGLVERGQWRAPARLAEAPNFRGYVVFLLPCDGRDARVNR